jgi:histidyl-tRNA synthetase
MIQRPRGTRDILPPDGKLWQAVEAVAQEVFGAFGAEEIRTPIFEPTELFVRSVGEATDIVHKEMYTFEDRKGRSLTLRPEGTAGVARAWIENRLADRSHPLRLYYIGPMFRYERMQRGRFRQFSQIGLEIVGADTVRQTLEPHRGRLCSDCKRRLEENPLRVLDCKVPLCQELAAGVPAVDEVAGEGSRRHVAGVEEQLVRLGIPYVRNPRLVRGLDYYLRTVFEVISPKLGSGTVICGGGRYDRLIADLGGPTIPGTGFAIGEDRLVEILPEKFTETVLGRPRLYLVPLGDGAQERALSLAREWVRGGVTVEIEMAGRSLKAALRRADRDGFTVVAILGEDELARGELTLRDLASAEQSRLALAELPRWWHTRHGKR